MKTKLLFGCIIGLCFYTFFSCGDQSFINNLHVIVDDKGIASGGHLFSAENDKDFYIDYVKYHVENGHLIVSDFDPSGLSKNVVIISKLTYKGNTYEVKSICSEDQEANMRYYPGFLGCSTIESVYIPSTVTTIFNPAFLGCGNLKQIDIAEGLHEIDELVFMGCQIKNITLPSSLTSLHRFAFTGCSNLTQIHLLATYPPTVYGSGNVEDITSTEKQTTLYVPKSSVSVYQSTEPWNQFEHIIGE